MRLRVALIAAVAAVLVAASSYGQEATLRYRWVKGEEVRYRIGREATTTMSGLPGAGEMTVTQNSVQVVRVSVDDAGPESATLRMTFESVRMEVATPMTKMIFDSAADKPSNPLGMTISAMIGESITLVVAPAGNVIKVEGMSRIFDKMAKALPQSPAANAQVLGQLRASLGDEAFSSMFSQGFAQFPDRPLKPGDSWSHAINVSVPIVGTISTATTSTLKAIEVSAGASIARIATLIVLKQDANAATGLSGMTVKLADGTGEGEVLFDISKGRVQKTSNKTDMPMSMSMTGPDGTQITTQGVNRTTMTMEIVEKF